VAGDESDDDNAALYFDEELCIVEEDELDDDNAVLFFYEEIAIEGTVIDDDIVAISDVPRTRQLEVKPL
jgi:hypothetical protein